MKKVTIDELDPPTTTSPADVLPLGGPLGTTDLAINYFELAPGSQFGFDLHRHLDQEEVFYIQQGSVVFETDTDEVEVATGEAIRFAPGEFQIGRNRGDERVIAIALGAPKETVEIEYLRPCERCGTRTVQPLHRGEDSRTFRLECAECGTTTEEFAL